MSEINLEFGNVGYSLIHDKDQYKVLQLTFDYEKGIIGTITVLSSDKDKNAAIERLKIEVARHLMF